MCAASPTSPGHRTGWREIIRPTPPLQWHSREKTRPASAKTPNLGCCERAGRTFSRFRDLTAMQGELFRACRRRPSSALPISDQAQLVWRAPASTEGLAAVPVGGGAAAVPTNDSNTQPKQISHAIPPRHESMDAQKPQNINDQISRPEIPSGELHAKLMGEQPVRQRAGPGCGARGRGRGLAGQRVDAPAPDTFRT